MTNHVRIVFSGGSSIEFVCDEITVSKRTGEVTQIQWKNAEPSPFFMRLADIQAVMVTESSEDRPS